MKTILKYMILIALPVLMFNCSDLEPVDYGEINPSIFPKTEEDLQAMVMSCYYPLRGAWWDGINHNSERGQMFVNDCCTEILTGKFGIQKMCAELSFTEMNNEITWFYYIRPGGEYSDGFSNKISRCTLVLDEIENSSLNADLKNKYLAEVRCARGYLSYILFDMYGPLVIAPIEVLKDPLKETPLPRLSNEEMVQFIEDDLLFAAEYLPTPKNAEYGRFSQGLAKTLLIRLYLHETVHDKTYYNKVETLAREIIDAKWYSLMSEYTTLFEFAGMTRTNPEYIFVVPSSIEGPNLSQWRMMVMPPASKEYPIGWATIQSTWWFYDTFEPADTRKTYMITGYSTNDGQVYNRENPSEFIDIGPLPQKYQIEIVGSQQSNLDIVLYRYPEVLLSLAEAIVMKSGGNLTQEAVDLMNQVRARAKLNGKTLADFPTKEAFINQLLTERSHEFWCENGQYRADLIRFDKLYDRIMELNNSQAPYAAKYKYVYPLPLSVIVDGKGMVKQNPGYNQ
ncbi:MAG: RagB/SusD family nutrient uptake outer membrane protein [Dysgonamonadaceae bacterium]|jgi:hypothetical protein|nr:RagB/SusD family nutrient uptake outer membrane protein [Dysgonamonadaceae bacterium]